MAKNVLNLAQTEKKTLRNKIFFIRLPQFSFIATYKLRIKDFKDLCKNILKEALKHKSKKKY